MGLPPRWAQRDTIRRVGDALSEEWARPCYTYVCSDCAHPRTLVVDCTTWGYNTDLGDRHYDAEGLTDRIAIPNGLS